MKKNLTRTLLSLAAFVLAALLLTAAVSADDYARTRTYSGQFADVPAGAWFYKNVADAYELGLINGKSETVFDPDGTLTVAETIKLAAVCNQLLTKGAVDDEAYALENAVNWYDGYVAYATQRDIVTETYEDYNAPATRGMVAVLFSRAISTSGVNIAEINSVEFGALTDVPTTQWYATSVYRLYRWGIMTGDENGMLNPESSVRRSEISAVVTRVIDPSVRKSAGTPAETPAQPDTPASSTGELVLYVGGSEASALTGIPGFAADITVTGGTPSVNASYSLDLVNSLTVEPDNISFSLRKGAGYEAFEALRGEFEKAAVGANGTQLQPGVDVYSRINELIYLWADGSRVTIAGMWYADHDGYTTYAFYFDETLSLDSVARYQLVCGTPGADTLKLCGMDDVAALVDGAYGVQASDEFTEATDSQVNTAKYAEAISAAKANASDIPFEYESDRFYIIYGAGLNGAAAEEYSLIFIYRDGTCQTVYQGKVTAIRVNTAGSTLYYNTIAPDGKEIRQGVSFD